MRRGLRPTLNLHSLLQNLVLWGIIRNFANMKPAKIFQQYVWLVNTLRQYKRLTLEEINDLWVKSIRGTVLWVYQKNRPSDLFTRIP